MGIGWREQRSPEGLGHSPWTRVVVLKGMRNSSFSVHPGGVDRWSYRTGCRYERQKSGMAPSKHLVCGPLHSPLQIHHPLLGAHLSGSLLRPPFHKHPLLSLSLCVGRPKVLLLPCLPFLPRLPPPTVPLQQSCHLQLQRACVSSLHLQFQALLDSLFDFSYWRHASPSSPQLCPSTLVRVTRTRAPIMFPFCSRCPSGVKCPECMCLPALCFS